MANFVARCLFTIIVVTIVTRYHANANITYNVRERLEKINIAMEKAFESLKAKLQKEERKKECEGFYWDNKCYWASVTAPDGLISYSSSLRSCKEKGGNPANIYNKKQYTSIMDYLRTKIPEGWKWITVWLGMSYDLWYDEVSFYNGSIAPNVFWRPANEWLDSKSFGNFTGMGIDVNKNATATDQGMFNYPQSWELYGIVCEI